MNPGCAHVEPELSAYLDGELAPAERARVEAHVHACARCAAELRELRKVGDSLRRWDAEETRYAQSTGFRNRVLARVGGQAGDLPAAEVRVWRGAAWAAAAAAGVVAAVAWWGTSPRDGAATDLDGLRARVDAFERDLAEIRGRAPAGRSADGAPASPGVPGYEPVDAPPPLVGPPAPRSEFASLGEGGDPWEARGDGMLLRDVVPDYERFVSDRRRLSIDERLARLERRENPEAAAPTAAAPAPTPLGAFLAHVELSSTQFPPFQRVQVWPIEMSNPSRAPRTLLLEAAIDERAVTVTEDAQGNVVAENADLKGRTVLLLAGDVLRGGRRDRVLRESVLLGPGRRMSLPVAGASVARESRAFRTFSRSRLLAPADLRALLAAGSFGETVSQRDVDSVVRSSIEGLGSPGGERSLENLWTNSELQREVSGYVDAFRKRLDRPNVVGFAFAAGPELVGAELCGDPETFRTVRDRLLRSHVLYALSRPSAAQGGPPSDAAVASLIAAAGRAVFDEPASAGDGVLGLFRSQDGYVFGAGLLDGTRVVHATVFSGLPESGAAAAARAGRDSLGRGPLPRAGGPREAGATPDRSAGGPAGSGIDSR